MADRMHNLRRQGRQDGLTLIEMLVTMIIFSLAVGLLFQAVIKVQKYTSANQNTSDTSGQLRLALDQIDRQVRSGNVLGNPANETSASCIAGGAGTCVRVYTQANGSLRCVQWQVTTAGAAAGTRILQSRNWSPTWQTDPNPSASVTPWVVQARGLAPTQAINPFTISASSAGVLQVRLEAVDPRRPGSRVPITSSLFGRNTNYGYTSNECTPAPS